MAAKASFSSLKFPQKLWKIVNECESDAISWDITGKLILIDYLAFENEYLDSNFGFKTSNITSFIRQLNLYGFQKLPASFAKELNGNVNAYKNENFVRGNKQLLEKVTRKPSGVKRQKKKVNFREKEKLPSKRLLVCQKAFSKALNKAAVKKKTGSRLFEIDSLDQEMIMKANQILCPQTDEAITNENDTLSEYSLLIDDSTLSDEVLDTIPVVLPPELEQENCSRISTGNGSSSTDYLASSAQRDLHLNEENTILFGHNNHFYQEKGAFSEIDYLSMDELCETTPTYLSTVQQWSTISQPKSSNVIVEHLYNDSTVSSYTTLNMYGDYLDAPLQNDIYYEGTFTRDSSLTSTFQLLSHSLTECGD